MRMEIEDYLQKQKDITYLKLTREVQEVRRFWQSFCFFSYQLRLFNICIFQYLSSTDYDAKKQAEIGVLEKTLEYQAQVKFNKMIFIN
jgi:hypothetical protein